jgi:hypothetical protein
MPMSLTRECSNSVLHLAQTRIHVGICHLERVTAEKLESIRMTDPTVHPRRAKLNQVLWVAGPSTVKVFFVPKAKIPEGIALKASSDSLNPSSRK